MRLRPLFDARKASSAPLHVAAKRAAATAASVRSPLEELDDAARDVRVVERERPLNAGAHDDDVLAGFARGIHHSRQVQERRDEHALAANCGRDDSARPIRRREDQRFACRHEVLARRVPEVESGDANGLALASEDSLAEGPAERASLLHLRSAVHPPIAGRKRLAHRRGGPDDVDHDPGRGRSGLVRGEDDVDSHAGTLAAVDEPLRCCRHPDRETYVSCSECGRGICPDCMTYGPVGIRCPDHATTGGKTAAPRQAARRASQSISLSGPIVTFTLIGINVGVFLVELLLGGQLNGTGNSLYVHGVLDGPAVADGQWWRLITAPFLHYGLLHLGMNMLVLWFIGPPLEEYFGHGRYLLVYLVSGLAGSAGALIWSGDALTVRASGAIFGIMGAALVLEARHIFVLGGQAMGLVVINLGISFVIPGISRGGHVGGLIGGALCALAFSSFRRSPALATLLIAAIGVASIGVAVAQVG